MRNLSKNAGLDYQFRKAEIQGNAGYGYGYGGFYGGGSRRGFRRGSHHEHLPSGDGGPSVERTGRPDRARGKNRGDPQEDDPQVPARVLNRLPGLRRVTILAASCPVTC